MASAKAMAKARKKFLNRNIREVLDDVISLLPGQGFVPILEYGHPRTEAIEHLIQLGVLTPVIIGAVSQQQYVDMTVKGWDYWEKVTTPRWYWFKQNWFPAIVAAATIAASVGGIVANALD